MLGADRPVVGGGVCDDAAQVDRAAVQRPLLVEAGEQQELLDEAPHAGRLTLDPGHRPSQRLVVGQPASLVELGVAPDGGDRGAQLVGGVGGEALDPLLAGLLLGERHLEAAEHGVEGRAQAAELGGVVGVLDPRREIAAGDGAGGVDHAVDGTEARSHHPPGDGRPGGAHDEQRQPEHRPEAVGGRVDWGERRGQEPVAQVAAASGRGEHPLVGAAALGGHGDDGADERVDVVGGRVGQDREGLGAVAEAGREAQHHLAVGEHDHLGDRPFVARNRLPRPGPGEVAQRPFGGVDESLVEAIDHRPPGLADHHPAQDTRRDGEEQGNGEREPGPDGHSSPSSRMV